MRFLEVVFFGRYVYEKRYKKYKVKIDVKGVVYYIYMQGVNRIEYKSNNNV